MSSDVFHKLRSPEFWTAVAKHIGDHPHEYDLNDDSERLDIVQIVCEHASRVQELCSMCDEFYPVPVEYHHTAVECALNQRAAEEARLAELRRADHLWEGRPDEHRVR